MTIEQAMWLRYLTLTSVVIYFVFTFFDNKRVKDEREELIQLKTYELVQKLTLGTLTAFAVIVALQPQFLAVYAIVVLVLANMYGEIAAKIYFRQKL